MHDRAGIAVSSSLTGKVAVVTGSSRGIGRDTAERLARDGAAVVVNYVDNEVAAIATVRSIEAAGGAALAVRADISCAADIERLFGEAMRQFGRLDILVANAGRCIFSPLAETTAEDFDRIFATNARGTFFCMQEALTYMADGGRIICVSTIGTVLNLPGGAAYFGAKAAVEQFCRVLARELAPRAITVNVLSPGFIDTDMLRDSLTDDPSMTAQLIGMTPLARLGRPADIADAIAFLAGPDAGWITRQNLPVDGGIISR